MIQTKYKLVRAGRMLIHRTQKKQSFYRLQALRDIPEHNVKTGDWGGYVTRKDVLSQEDSSWVGGSAQVIGRVKIEGNVYIGDKAVVRIIDFGWNLCNSFIVLNGDVRITENATVFSKIYQDENYLDNVKFVLGNTEISGNAIVDTVKAIGPNARIYGNAVIDHAVHIGVDCEIYGNAKVSKGCTVSNGSKIFGSAVLEEDVTVQSSVVSGKALILAGRRVEDGKLDEGQLAPAQGYLQASIKEPKAIVHRQDSEQSPEIPEDATFSRDQATQQGFEYLSRKLAGTTDTGTVLQAYAEVTEGILSYESDIVKIIRYPAMTDKTDPYTLKMMMALKTAKRLVNYPDSDAFQSAVYALEEAFMSAESNAQKLASNKLSEAEKKKTAKAKDLFRLASNEASTEQEKKVAFVQGFKALEGVLVVPEIAVDTFRLKIGLKEIEATQI
jgi:carbonic anhydrase/acetyltransferase-like protein (isoleucine patch superfamily)